jgi:hypothetical protein
VIKTNVIKFMKLNEQQKAQATSDAVDIIKDKLTPAEVVDSEAYAQFKALDNHPILNEKKYYTLSNGRKISLGTADFRLKEIIKELPSQEQKQVMSLRKIFNSILCRRNAKQRKCYGTIIDSKGNYAHTGNKFAPKSAEIIELFGRMFSTREVHEIVVKQFQITCSHQAIINFREKNISEINAKIEQHQRSYSDIRLGHKRSRLEELIWIYGSRKRLYEVTKKGDDHRLLLMTLEQIRKEIEGDSLRIDGTLTHNVEVTVQQHIHNELFVNFPLKEIIMARVAAKLKLDPTQLISQLNRSYYNNFITGTTDEIPAYPSTQTYDFDKIRRIHKQQEQLKQIEDANVIKVITPEKAATATSLKDVLLAKLANKSSNVNHTKNALSGKFIDRANKAAN